MADTAAPVGDPANVSAVSWTLYNDAFQAINGPAEAAVAQIDGALGNQVLTVLKVALTLYLMVRMYVILLSNGSGNPLGEIAKPCLSFATVASLITSGVFHEHIGQLLLNDLPNGISQALTGFGGGPALAGGQLFDTIWIASATTGLKVYDALPGWSMKALFLGLLVFAFMGSALIAVSLAFVVYLGAHVMLELIIAIGPLGVACYMIAPTRGYGNGWLNTALGAVLAKVLVVALLALILRVEQTQLTRIAGVPAGANEVAGVLGLFGVAGLLAIGAVVARDIPSFAARITGGAYHALGAHIAQVRAAVGGVGGFFSDRINAARSGGGAPSGGNAPAFSGAGIPAFAGAAQGYRP